MKKDEKSLLHRVFIAQTNDTFIQFFRYSFVGGTAFIVDFSTFYLCTEVFDIMYLFSNVISFICGISVNYLLATLWIFHKNSSVLKNRWTEFAATGVIGVIGLGLNTLLLWGFTSFFGIHYLLSKVIAAAICYLWNFTGRKYILFNKKTS